MVSKCDLCGEVKKDINQCYAFSVLMYWTMRIS